MLGDGAGFVPRRDRARRAFAARVGIASPTVEGDWPAGTSLSRIQGAIFGEGAQGKSLPLDPSVRVLSAPGESLGSHLYLVDPMGRWMMRAPVALEPSKFKRDLERVLRASSSWDTPGR